MAARIADDSRIRQIMAVAEKKIEQILGQPVSVTITNIGTGKNSRPVKEVKKVAVVKRPGYELWDHLTAKEIMKINAEALGLKVSDYTNKNQNDAYTKLRKCNSHILYHHYGSDQKQIGKLYGLKGHTTVRSQIRTAEAFITLGNKAFVDMYNRCIKSLNKACENKVKGVS